MACTQVVHTINLGGIDTPSITSTPVNPSPQERMILKGTQDYIPIIVIPGRQILRIKYAAWTVFTQQARQDLSVKLKVASDNIRESGELSESPGTTPPFDPPRLFSRTRLVATTGMPYNKISNATSTGLHDNYLPLDNKSFLISYETELVTFFVINQSDVYDHPIRVELSGWLVPVLGRSPKDIFEALAKIG